MTHIAFHQISEPSKLPNLPCGLCGVGELLQYTPEPSAAGCVTWMQTSDGKLVSRSKRPTWVPKTRCKHN